MPADLKAGLKFALKIKSAFFDRAAVIADVTKKAVPALSRFGAFVRTRARSSMRRRKKSAAAGSPPSAHTGDIKRLLFFSWDSRTRSVVIGPTPFRDGKAPSLLEFGGTTTRKTAKGRSETLHYRAFPFMQPAFEAEKPNLPKAWAGAVRS